jgi:hypothetical protein
MKPTELQKHCECATWCRTKPPMLTKHHPDCPKYKPKMIRIWTVTPDKDTAPCTERDLSAVMAWIESAEPGAVMQIVVGELDEAIYNEMPEYLGP